MPLVQDMFHLHLPIVEKIVRPIIVYFVLIVFLRIFGKRELAQLNPFDLVVLLSLSNVVQNALIGDDNSVTGGIIGAFTLLAVNFAMAQLLFRAPKLEEVLEGAPTVLIESGEICEDALEKELMSKSELMTVAHRQGFEHLDDVDKCVLEPGGAFAMYHRRPTDDEMRFQLLMDKLDALTREVQDLRGRA
jgi:uncharacterized membrane protein YcaP (DUF421 family)